jgi:hypothetical protein
MDGLTNSAAVMSQLAILGGVPADTATQMFRRMLWGKGRLSPDAVFALPWWCHIGDTISLNEAVRRADLLSRRKGDKPAATLYLANATRAYLALSRADTTTALGLFLHLSHAQNYRAIGDWERYQTIRLLNVRGRHRDAVERINQEVRSTALPLDVLVALERGRALEALGDRAAAKAYAEVAAAWAHADAALQPIVGAARSALSRLRVKPGT